MSAGHQNVIIATLLAIGLCLCAFVYSPGLSGQFMFDDFPTIVDNRGVEPDHADVPSLLTAALSSPSSELKHPMASLSFAANYLATGMRAGQMKVTNLIIHLLNGIVAFFIVRRLIRLTLGRGALFAGISSSVIVCSWLVLPINVTAVLYVVQRMESMANLCVLLGMWGYLAGRERMLKSGRGLALATLSVIAGTFLGVLSKETAVMLPLYTLILEVILFKGNTRRLPGEVTFDRCIALFYVVVLLVPILLGSVWLVPKLLAPPSWETRDFTLATRLLSEPRIIIDYTGWTLVPTASALPFYHDDFFISTGILIPPTTAFALASIGAVIGLIIATRRRLPLFATGLALSLAAHLLTGTVLPLELIYEHRNYFPSLALLLAVMGLYPLAAKTVVSKAIFSTTMVMLLVIYASFETQTTAEAWSGPLNLSKGLAARAPDSPRAQYELGRACIIDSRYDPGSPSVPLAYPPLERAAALPDSTILPLQALIFFNARLHRPINGSWWNAVAARLRAHRPRVEDESALIPLVQCRRSSSCELPVDRMNEAFEAAMSHPAPSGHLLASYAAFAWNEKKHRSLGEKLMYKAVAAIPSEPVYWLSLARYQMSAGRLPEAGQSVAALRALNYGNRLASSIDEISNRLSAARSQRQGS